MGLGPLPRSVALNLGVVELRGGSFLMEMVAGKSAVGAAGSLAGSVNGQRTVTEVNLR